MHMHDEGNLIKALYCMGYVNVCEFGGIEDWTGDSVTQI